MRGSGKRKRQRKRLPLIPTFSSRQRRAYSATKDVEKGKDRREATRYASGARKSKSQPSGACITRSRKSRS